MKILAADGYIVCCGVLRIVDMIYHDVEVISANSIDEVLASVRELHDLDLDLDLVLLDTSMPGMENFDGLRRVVENLYEEVPVIVTSDSQNHTQIFAAIRNGARGYIPPWSKPCVLQHALPLVMAGEFYIPAGALSGGKLGELRGFERSPPRMTSSLTQRQHEITIMLAEGKSNKEIARELKVLEGTVKLHVRWILRNLGVRNRTEAVIAAVYAGYLPNQTLGSAPPTLECVGGEADHKTPGASASSRQSQSETKHRFPAGCEPPPLPDCSAPNAYDAAQDGVNELPVERLHRRTGGRRPRSRNGAS